MMVLCFGGIYPALASSPAHLGDGRNGYKQSGPHRQIQIHFLKFFASSLTGSRRTRRAMQLLLRERVIPSILFEFLQFHHSMEADNDSSIQSPLLITILEPRLL